jgi:hypothetical protein
MSIIAKVVGLGIGYFGYSICAADTYGFAAFAVGIPSIIVGTSFVFSGFNADVKEKSSEKTIINDMHKQITEVNHQLKKMQKNSEHKNDEELK